MKYPRSNWPFHAYTCQSHTYTLHPPNRHFPICGYAPCGWKSVVDFLPGTTRQWFAAKSHRKSNLGLKHGTVSSLSGEPILERCKTGVPNKKLQRLSKYTKYVSVRSKVRKNSCRTVLFDRLSLAISFLGVSVMRNGPAGVLVLTLSQ